MIKPQQFAGLAIATAVSLITAAVIYSVTNRWSAGKVEGAALVPGLARQEKAIAAIEITQGDRKVTLDRAGEQWSMRERSGYPANPERVSALLNAIARSELIDPKTAAKDRHKQLELEDPASKDAKSRGVRILDTKGKPLGEIVLGKARYDAFGSGKGGTYVRRLNETQTWLATGEPKGGIEFKDWASATAYEVETAKAVKLTLEHPGEEALVIEKNDTKDAADKDKDPKAKEQKFKLAKMPDGKKLKDGANIDQIVQGFAGIEIEDVRKLDATPAGDKVSVLRLEQEGGLITTFRLRKDGDASWLSFQATGGEGDVKKKGEEINAKANGWEFKIPQWKVDQIGKRRTDLFETS